MLRTAKMKVSGPELGKSLERFRRLYSSERTLATLVAEGGWL
jgi:hypothetical protein